MPRATLRALGASGLDRPTVVTPTALSQPEGGHPRGRAGGSPTSEPSAPPQRGLLPDGGSGGGEGEDELVPESVLRDAFLRRVSRE